MKQLSLLGPRGYRQLIPGERVGRWTILGEGDRFRENGNRYKGRSWRAICDCGTVKTVAAKSLIWGGSKSCGCTRPKGAALSWARYDDNWARITVRNFAHGAVRREVEWGLDESVAVGMLSRPCAYCGRVGVNKTKRQRRGGVPFRYNGIDRVDSARGYEEGNVVTCCADCNRAKRCLSVDEFVALCERVAGRASYARRVLDVVAKADGAEAASIDMADIVKIENALGTETTMALFAPLMRKYQPPTKADMLAQIEMLQLHLKYRESRA